MAAARRIAQIGAGRVIAVLVREHAVEHQDFFTAGVAVGIKVRTGGVAHDAGGACDWVSPAFPDTFGKLMSLLEVSDAEKAIHSGVQG